MPRAIAAQSRRWRSSSWITPAGSPSRASARRGPRRPRDRPATHAVRRRARARCGRSARRAASRIRSRARRRSGVRLHAVCASRSNACSKTSSGWAPRTSRRRSSTKAGTPVAPARTASRRRRRDDVGVAIAGEDVVHLLRGQPDLAGQHAQLFGVADVAALGPVRIHQPVVEGAVQAVLSRQLAEAERRLRVGDDLRMRPVLEAARLEHGVRARDALLAVAREQLLPRQPIGRVLGVQVERAATSPRRRTGARATRPSARPHGRTVRCSRPDRDDVLAHAATVAGRGARRGRRPASASPVTTRGAGGPVRAHVLPISSARRSSTVSRRRASRADPSATSTAAGLGTPL